MTPVACKACKRRPLLQWCAALAFGATLAACTTTPPPTEQLAAARAMVAQAQPMTVADGLPELKIAQAKLARAEDSMQRGDYVEARIFAEQAEVDARYAWTLAENARMQRMRNDLDRRQ